MTTLREAAQQAVEYMKSVGKMDMHPEEWAIVGRLEAALAEPVQQGCDHCNHPLYAATKCRVCGRVTEPVQDPDSPERRCGGPGCDMRCCQPVQEPMKLWPLAPLTGYYDVGGKRVWLEKDEPFPQPAPPQRPAEPAAYSVGRTLHWHDGKGVNDAQLYLAPPQRKPLTEEQKQAIHNETGAGHSLICLVESYINGIKE